MKQPVDGRGKRRRDPARRSPNATVPRALQKTPEFGGRRQDNTPLAGAITTGNSGQLLSKSSAASCIPECMPGVLADPDADEAFAAKRSGSRTADQIAEQRRLRRSYGDRRLLRRLGDRIAERRVDRAIPTDDAAGWYAARRRIDALDHLADGDVELPRRSRRPARTGPRSSPHRSSSSVSYSELPGSSRVTSVGRASARKQTSSSRTSPTCSVGRSSRHCSWSIAASPEAPPESASASASCRSASFSPTC